MKCSHCGAGSFRTSHLRLVDIPRLLLFQYPVRCRTCRERDYAGLLLALNIRQAGKLRHLEDEDRRARERSRRLPSLGSRETGARQIDPKG
jgi:hypothetical protein